MRMFFFSPGKTAPKMRQERKWWCRYFFHNGELSSCSLTGTVVHVTYFFSSVITSKRNFHASFTFFGPIGSSSREVIGHKRSCILYTAVWGVLLKKFFSCITVKLEQTIFFQLWGDIVTNNVWMLLLRLACPKNLSKLDGLFGLTKRRRGYNRVTRTVLWTNNAVLFFNVTPPCLLQ